MPESAARRTPLYSCHLEAGAKMVDFGGWAMPVQYAGLIDEHHAVRQRAGLFDVSHMGELRCRGRGALALLQRLTPNDVSKLRPGRAHYNALLTERATYLDDLLIYQLAEDDYLVVVNAANIEQDFDWVRSHAGDDCVVENLSDAYALIALQGPAAPAMLARHTATDLDGLRYYRFASGEVCGVEALISRTGYTGEDGFELYLAPDAAVEVWRTLLDAEADLVPAGLGARDTLRLEAGMALYGHEIDAETTPYEAGLGWTVKLGKGDFIGRDVLARQKEEGPGRKLVGFEIDGRGIARQGHEVVADGSGVATVASGTWSPTLERAIGTALVPSDQAAAGSRLEIAVRKRRLPAVVRELPFYRRGR